MVYRLDAGTVIDAEGNLVIENLYSGSVALKTQAQGTVSGYNSGSASPNSYSNVIEKFPFSSDANATDVGDLTLSRSRLSGTSSTSHGYSAGGVGSPFANKYNNIDKFSFSVDGNATDVGDLTAEKYENAGNTSTVSGYSSGGNPVTTIGDIIQKYPFSSDANATDVGDLTQQRRAVSGQSSTTHGYASGDYDQSDNIIDKFPFSVDANATDVGDLTEGRRSTGGNSSSTHGYASGGYGSTFSNIIDKFSFSSDGNATDVGDLTLGRNSMSEGANSTLSGYLSGGFVPPSPGTKNIIEKFSFSTDANATDVGDLTVEKSESAGQQV